MAFLFQSHEFLSSVMNISIYNSLNAAHPSLFIDSDEQKPVIQTYY